MKKLLALLLALALLLPVFVLAEEYDGDEEADESFYMDDETDGAGADDDDDLLIETLTENEYELDDDGNLILGGYHLSPEEIEKLEDLTAQVELNTAIDPGKLYINTELPDNVINILLIGVDARGTKDVQLLSEQMRYSDDEPRSKSIAKRSDVIMILSIDKDDGSIKLSSIARNTYVDIPDRTSKSIIANSFGHAIYEDGKYKSWVDNPLNCIATVNKNFELNIQYYVAINFFGVEEIIESLGGVDIDLTKKEANAINTYLSMKTIYKKQNGEYVLDENGKKQRASHGKEIANSYDNHSEGRKALKSQAGVQHLDGLQGLMYARLRHIDNDFVRTARTRHLLDSLLKPTMTRVKTGELDIVNMVTNWSRYFITNIPLSEMAGIAMSVVSKVSLGDLENATTMISEYRIPEDGSYSYSTVNGASVTVMNKPQKATENLHEFIYGEYYPAD